LAVLPKKGKKAAKPARTPPENAAPIPEDPDRQLPTMQANLMSLFHGIDVVIKDSFTPGRWHVSFEDVTTDQVRLIAVALGSREIKPDLALPAPTEGSV
jgi:hypothetical protein